MDYQTQQDFSKVWQKLNLLSHKICCCCAASGVSSWLLSGNSGTNPVTNYIGTSDATNLFIKTNNTSRIEIDSDGSRNDSFTATGGIPVFFQMGNNIDGIGASGFQLGFGSGGFGCGLLGGNLPPLIGFAGDANSMVISAYNKMEISTLSGPMWIASHNNALTLESSNANPITFNGQNFIFNNALQIIDGTQSQDYVLTSDSAGNTSWQPRLGTLTQYANNAAAIAGGLSVGKYYYTNVAGDGIVKIVI